MGRAVFAVVLALGAQAAHAQYKVSEVMDKGGRIMNGEEVRAELSGATITGVNEFGASFEIALKKDGKTEGVIYTPRGPGSLSGTWLVNAKNQICTEFVFSLTGATISRCVWYWKAGGEYYSTNSQTDAEAAADLVDCLLGGGRDCKRDIVLGKRTVKK